jgi:MFS transporter, OPA family, sugar phosphate sensor protein UhpC
MSAPVTEITPPKGQWRIFSILWVTYASYYLCRANFAVAQPAILKEFPNWTAAQIGLIPSLFAGCYAAGQIINGTLGQKLGARVMMTAALLIAALTNLAFSNTSSYGLMLLLWGLNGFGQSAGWALTVNTISNWTPAHKRATTIGLLSTCYQAGNVLAWLLAGFLCDRIGWRAAFSIPAVFLFPVALLFAAGIRNSPEDPVKKEKRYQNPVGKTNAAVAPSAAPSFRQILSLTFFNKYLWLLGVIYFCLNAVRFTFLNWTVQYLTDFYGVNIRESAWMAITIPMVGSGGAVFAGWASDRLFHKRSAPICTLMLSGLALTCLFFITLNSTDRYLATFFLGLAGFMIYGPDMLLAGALAIEFSHPKIVVTATGLIMCLGNIGAILSGVGIGYVRDIARGRWEIVFILLAGLAAVSALLASRLWKFKHTPPAV